MCWLLARFASFLGTIVAAVTGAAASQTLAFIYAYQQRLGGHLDEAQRTLDGMRSGGMIGAPSDPAAHRQLLAAFAGRVEDLRNAYDAIARAGVFAKPAAFIAHGDYEIVSATLKSFTPSVPVDLPSLLFAFTGLAIGWAVWQAGEAAVTALSRRRRHTERSDRLPSGRPPG